MTLAGNKQDRVDRISLFTSHRNSSGAAKIQSAMCRTSGQFSALSKLVKNSGAYALSSVVTPLLSLLLAPFLTHTLSTSDYGALTLLNMIIGLVAGITQLGLGSAFFRAYNYDCTTRHEKHAVVATTTMLLFIVSVLTAIGMILFSSFLAGLLLERSSFSGFIVIAGSVICVQNLTVPGLSWLRAENQGVFYSVLSISNMLIALLANIVLVGVLHWGIAGSLIATGTGYMCVVICTLPFIISQVGMRIRMDIARNLLGFGLPLIVNFASYWVLQLSDRYLLSRFSSLAETAKYAVAYTLGSAMATVVIGPFTLAWPTTMFTIAKSKDAPRVFQQIFRWLSLFLLLAAFCLSFIGVVFLKLLFPATYHSVAFVIPIVSTSMVFYGIYYMFVIGVNVKRKTWIISIFMVSAAIVNLVLNLFMIPLYGAMGAALTTLAAYILLVLMAYVVNQRIYPLPFEVGRFIIALFIGGVLYAGCGVLAQSYTIYSTCTLYVGALLLYGGCLVVLGRYPSRSRKLVQQRRPALKTQLDAEIMKNAALLPTKICMHVLGCARTDERVIREAITLVEVGYTVSIVDIESEAQHTDEIFRRIYLKHIIVSKAFFSTRFAHWTFVRAALILYKGTFRLLRTPADIYHAHDVSGLLPCYIAARMRGKPLIFDAHELPLTDMSIRSRRLLTLLSFVLSRIIPRCAGVITVSAPIAQEIYKQYHGSPASLVRNIPAYKVPLKSNRLRQCLALHPETRIALFQGYLLPNRGLDLLITAAKFLNPDIVIVIMGKDCGEQISQLEVLAANEGVTDCVKFLPPVPYKELLEWTASADIGLIIYRPDCSLNVRMCLPNKLFEYLMAGLPILSSQLDAIAEVVRAYDAGHIVSSLTPAAIGEAINTMVSDRSRLEHMQRNALDAARKDLCWEKEKQELIQLYQRVGETRKT